MVYDDSRDTYPDALALYNKAIEYDIKLLAATPQSPQRQLNQARGYWNRGNLFKKMGKIKEAETDFVAGNKIFENVLQNNPDVSTFEWNYASFLNDYAAFLSIKGSDTAAKAKYEESIKLIDSLLGKIQDRPTYVVQLMQNYSLLSGFYQGTSPEIPKDLNKVLEYKQKAKKIGEKYIQRFPDDLILNMEYALALSRVALIANEQGNQKLALDLGPKSLAFAADYLEGKDESISLSTLNELLLVVGSFGMTAVEQDKLNILLNAADSIDQLINLVDYSKLNFQPLVLFYNQIGDIKKKNEKYSDATEFYEKAVSYGLRQLEIEPWNWYARANVSKTFRELNEIYKKMGDQYKQIEALQNYMRHWGIEMLSLDAEALIDPNLPKDKELLTKLEAGFVKPQSMERFTVPVKFNGRKTPFHVYVTNVKWPNDPLGGQVRWVEEKRGGKFPKDVVESFRKLHKIAHENNVSFVDLCVYALGKKDEKNSKKSASKQN